MLESTVFDPGEIGLRQTISLVISTCMAAAEVHEMIVAADRSMPPKSMIVTVWWVRMKSPHLNPDFISFGIYYKKLSLKQFSDKRKLSSNRIMAFLMVKGSLND